MIFIFIGIWMFVLTNSGSLIKDRIISQIKLHIPTFRENEIPAALKEIKPVKPGSSNLNK